MAEYPIPPGSSMRWRQRRVVLGVLIVGAIATVMWKAWPRARWRDPLAVECMKGVARSCYKFGVKLSQGEGVTEDKKAAAEFFLKGCHAGDMLSCWTLGDMYHRGEGVSHNSAEAEKLLNTVCEHGGDVACYQLGRMLAAGDGIQTDPKRAATLFRRACDLGLEDACKTLRDQPR